MNEVKTIMVFEIPTYVRTRSLNVRVDEIREDWNEDENKEGGLLEYNVWFYSVPGVSDSVLDHPFGNYVSAFNAVYHLLKLNVQNFDRNKTRWFIYSPGWSFGEESWKYVDDLCEILLNWDDAKEQYIGFKGTDKDIPRNFYGISKEDIAFMSSKTTMMPDENGGEK